MILLDTTVLVYATGGDHPLREPCRRIVDAVGDGTVRATTTVEVLQEYARVRARRQGRDAAARLVRDLAALLAPLVVVDGGDLLAGMDLFRSTDRIGASDAVLAAVVARREHLEALVSADRGFAAVPDLRRLDPAVDDVVGWAAARG